MISKSEISSLNHVSLCLRELHVRDSVIVYIFPYQFQFLGELVDI
jgi:hypothetical protein